MSLTAKVAELEATKSQMEEHSKELLEELRSTREQQLEQLKIHAATTAEASDRRREQYDVAAREREVAAEAWASRVNVLQEEAACGAGIAYQGVRAPCGYRGGMGGRAGWMAGGGGWTA